METCALTAEYNPFHKGHQEQLAVLRRDLGQEAGILVCLSGPFCQRGVPALLDKGVRAHLALEAGADLVLELPQAFATASAERFAEGAVRSFLATGVVRNLAYGTEDPDRQDQIKKAAALLAEEPQELGQAIRQGIGQGLGFAAAREEALASLTSDPSLGQLLRNSNTILAVEYEKALLRFGPLPTLALPLFDKEKNSASLIRQIIWEAIRTRDDKALWPLMQGLTHYLPPASVAAVLAAATGGTGLVHEEMIPLSLLLAPAFRDPARLEAMAGMQGGLAGRISKAIKEDPGSALGEGASPYQDLIQRLASRAHPASRVRRAILAAALGVEAGDRALTQEGPGYIRILGFNRRGQRLLSFMRKLARLPLVVKASDFRLLKEEAAQAQARLDLYAQAVWNREAGLPRTSEFDRQVIQVR